jgi:nitric oxide reductase NorD protein
VSQLVDTSRFTLLAHSVAGRPIQVIEGGYELAYTDGQSIFVPRSPVDLQPASVVAQAALLAIGSFDRQMMARITGHQTLRRRYLLLECKRAAASLESVLPHQLSSLLATLYDGPTPKSPGESLAWSLQARRRLPDPPDWLGTIKPIRMLRAAGQADATIVTPDLTSPPAEDAPPDVDDEEESDRSRILELLSVPLRTPFSSMLEHFFGMGRAPGSDQAGVGEFRVGGRGTGSSRTKTKFAVDVEVTPGAPTMQVGFRYPEWDFARQSYRSEWCTVAEFDPPDATADSTPLPGDDRMLRRELARIGLSHQRHRRQQHGDVLDFNALVDVVVRQAAGVDSDTRIYECKRRTAHDLSVLVLLDTTGSTREATIGRRVFDQQRELAARLTSALDDLGDRVATFGFFSQGRHAVRFIRVKEFDDRYDVAAQRRLSALSPTGFTRLGAAIRHGTHILDTRGGTSQKLLVIVGDGFPYENGYTGGYAEHDSRKALSEAVIRGIGCVCLSVGSTTDRAVVARVWGGVPYRGLNDSSELAGSARPMFGLALRTAAATKRSIGSENNIEQGALP